LNGCDYAPYSFDLISFHFNPFHFLSFQSNSFHFNPIQSNSFHFNSFHFISLYTAPPAGPGLTHDEAQAHMSMWVMAASPLLTCVDVRNMTADVKAILTNPVAMLLKKKSTKQKSELNACQYQVVVV
jgi:hypothetical protein